ncbi:MAG: hypothetical protein WBJ62_04130 [Coriobacteriia bacterium]|jgi:hypothetical protein
MAENRADEILALLHDSAFTALRHESSRDALPFKVFQQMPMPEGYTADETWAILTAIRRQTAIVLPWRSYHVRENTIWYSNTQTMATRLAQLDARCKSGSPLDQVISERTSRYLLVQPLVEELLAAAWRDGIHTRYEDVRALLLRGRPPASPAERVLLNSQELLYDLDRYAHRQITMGLIEEMYERVSEGVGPLDAVPYERDLVVVGSPYSDPDIAMGTICRMARGENTDPFIHPLFIATSMAHIFWDFRPLPACNALVELQIRRLFLRRAGYPVLVYLPFAAIWRAWEDGTIHPPQVVSRPLELDPDCGEGMDITTGQSVFLQLLMDELARFEVLVAESKEHDDRVSAILRHHPHINDRQRAILDEAIRRPDREYRIDAHRKMHGIAYATARQDLLGLESAGFLQRETHGKSFVFRPASDLKSRIEGHSEG